MPLYEPVGRSTECIVLADSRATPTISNAHRQVSGAYDVVKGAAIGRIRPQPHGTPEGNEPPMTKSPLSMLSPETTADPGGSRSGRRWTGVAMVAALDTEAS